MSMLKYVFTLFAFMLVSLAPVSADEGYIPYFPDFLEPDGIGFRGPAEIRKTDCWAENGKCNIGDPKGTTYVEGYSRLRSYPITLEYKKNYFLKKLLYLQTFADIGETKTNRDLQKWVYLSNQDSDHHYNRDINSDPFLKEFLTKEEKSKLSSLDSSRVFDLQTKSNFISFGVSIGFDLWIIEQSFGPFLMYHNTSISLRSCKDKWMSIHGGLEYTPTKCQFHTDEIINLDKKNYSGFAYGTRNQLSIVFLQTDNWRISTEYSETRINKIFDSSFNSVQYRGLMYFPEMSSISTLGCKGGTIGFDEENQQNVSELDCRNSQGQDLSQSSDYTYGLQITYYFR